MKRWSQTLCCLMAVACADCAGTIDDPASFEDYASSVRDPSPRDGGAELDATPAAAPDTAVIETPVEEEPADTGPAPEPDAGTPPDASEPEVVVNSCDFKGLIMSKCGAASCHGGPSASTGLDLTSEDLRGRMDGRGGSGTCSTKPMINDANPEQSTLYLVLTGNICGITMPLGGTLSADEKACVLEWIKGP